MRFCFRWASLGGFLGAYQLLGVEVDNGAFARCMFHAAMLAELHDFRAEGGRASGAQETN